MSNINNQTQNLYSIELVQDLDHEAAATVTGGASAQVFTDANFSGTPSTIFDYDVSLFDPNVFNDRISSIKVYSGEWTFWSDANYSGSGLTFGPGEYSNIADYYGGKYNDVFSSAKANIR
ncbi:beta/gamma crystallin-related protein [Nostoc sp.]|uniref:beta/gamma crystallin-related protein n=1 Tax=Nostoc sp. TaxID=1180 RepID=UPI002FF9C8A0